MKLHCQKSRFILSCCSHQHCVKLQFFGAQPTETITANKWFLWLSVSTCPHIFESQVPSTDYTFQLFNRSWIRRRSEPLHNSLVYHAWLRLRPDFLTLRSTFHSLVLRFYWTLPRLKTPSFRCSKAVPEHNWTSSVFHGCSFVLFFVRFIFVPVKVTESSSLVLCIKRTFS